MVINVEMMNRLVLVLLSFALCAAVRGEAYRTMMYDSGMRSLQVLVDGQPLSLPYIELGSEQSVQISFDDISYDAKSFYFRIVHCNADWTPSSLSSMEYVEGFDNGMITDYEYSQNTTANYIHYSFSVPNEDLRIMLSGNYAVEIAQDNDFDNPVAVACFSVYEPLASVEGDVTGNTLRELNGKYQQLEIEVDYSGMQIKNPMNELYVTVMQNGRRDNMRVLARPTFTRVNRFVYQNTENLIFEGGNQYRSVDFSSRYTYGAGIERIFAEDNVYHVIMTPDVSRASKGVEMGQDVNGEYVVNVQDGYSPDYEADYMWVHFWLPTDEPMLQGSVYLTGSLVENRLDGTSRMNYDFENKGYYIDLYLKQGGYNYMYGYVQKGSEEMTLVPFEGSHWQTENRYEVCVYYRPFGERYDRLISYGVIYAK